MAEQQPEQIAQDIPEHENHRQKPDRPNYRTQDLSAKVSIKDLHPTVLWLLESDDTVTSSCPTFILEPDSLHRPAHNCKRGYGRRRRCRSDRPPARTCALESMVPGRQPTRANSFDPSDRREDPVPCAA